MKFHKCLHTSVYLSFILQCLYWTEKRMKEHMNKLTNKSTNKVCWVRFKKNFKYFNRDLHSIVPYGLKFKNKHSLKSWIEGQICKSILSKMTSTKTNKNKKWTPLPNTNFLRYTTLLLGPKRFVHSKGPKIALCLC